MKISNGILYIDGKPQIGIGASYYASFHPHKYPVPPEGDRVGEMEKDIEHMSGLGFNVVRTSALGEVRWENGRVTGSFPFADKIAQKAEDENMAVLMRIHNYSMVMRYDKDEVAMVSNKGTLVDRERRDTFMPDCINHPGVIEDNELATKFVAEHFSKYKSVIMHLIYNEPAYPYSDFYDYHPESIKAYRKWLAEKGIKSEEEAKAAMPPTERPLPGEDDSDWINFRLFSTEAMSRFLGDMNDWVKKGNPQSESMTCMMPVMLHAGGVKMGEDLFALGDGMDIIGVTDYLPCMGQPYYYSLLYADVLGSTAQMNKKHIWAAECNAHTTLTSEEWQRETYTLLGAGFKGLIYYQWRADYDNKKGPEIGMFGILKNDGTPTGKYEIISKTNKLVKRISENLALAEKISSDIAILFSHHANAFYDAHENGWRDIEEAWTAYDNFDPGSFIYNFDRNVMYIQSIHREIRERGIAPHIVRSTDLKENKLGIKTLIVPTAVGLSDKEIEEINNFAKNGGLVFIYQPSDSTCGYTLNPYSRTDIKIHRHMQRKMAHSCSIDDVIYISGYKNPFEVISEDRVLGFNVLENEKQYIVTITNFDTFERFQKNAVIKIKKNLITGTKATFHTVEREINIKAEVTDESVVFRLPEIHTGCFVIIDKEEKA